MYVSGGLANPKQVRPVGHHGLISGVLFFIGNTRVISAGELGICTFFYCYLVLKVFHQFPLTTDHSIVAMNREKDKKNKELCQL